MKNCVFIAHKKVCAVLDIFTLIKNVFFENFKTKTFFHSFCFRWYTLLASEYLLNDLIARDMKWCGLLCDS